MSVKLVRGNIVNAKVDAIVNSASSDNLMTAGVENAIINAAGSLEVMLERDLCGDIFPGQVVVTSAGALKSKYLLHTVGPTWVDGNHREDEILRRCYYNSLCKAKELGCTSIAFPLIASGIKCYPKGRGIDIAVSAFDKFLENDDMTIYLFLYDDGANEKASERFYDVMDYVEASVRKYIEDNSYAPVDESNRASFTKEFRETLSSVDELLMEIEEKSFCDVLNEYLEANKLANGKDSDIYNAANIDKGYFYKIKRHERSQPGKVVVMSLAIAFKLDIQEAQEFLSYAGYAFNPGSRVDMVFKYFIINKIYDMYEIESVFADAGMLDENGEIKENKMIH